MYLFVFFRIWNLVYYFGIFNYSLCFNFFKDIIFWNFGLRDVKYDILEINKNVK